MAEPEYPILKELETKLKLRWVDTDDIMATQRAIIQVEPELAYLELPRGRKGDKGDAGPAISIQGIITADSQLPASAEVGHAYVNTSTKGLAVWNGSSWFKVDNFAGVDADVQQFSRWLAQLESDTRRAVDAAKRAEFAAEETIQQVEGDFATRNYVDAANWNRGGVGTEVTSIDQLEIGSHGISSSATAERLGLPGTLGTLLISRIANGKTVLYLTQEVGSQGHEIWMTSISGGTTAPWAKVHPVETDSVFNGAPPGDATSVSQLTDGEWSIASTTVAERLGLPGTLGTLKVMPIVSGKTLMYFSQQAGNQANELWISSISGGVVAPWTKVGGDSGGGAPGLKTVGVTLTAGSTLNGDAGRYRVLAQVTAPVTRWRVHFESRRMIYETTQDFTLGAVQVGDHTGSGAIANVQTLKSGDTSVSGNSEWVSKWIDRDLGEEVLIDFQASGSSLMSFQAPAFKLNGSTWQTSKYVPLAVWIEVETYAETPVVAMIGDSTGSGQGADRPVHDSALHIAARKHEFIPMNYSYPGSGLNTMADGDLHIYKRWEHLDKPDSVIIQAGSNNIHGGLSLAEIQGHLQDVVTMARDKISPVVLGSTVKARYPNSGDFAPALTAYNTYVKTQPAGIRDYVDFYQAVSPSGTVASADAADAAHLTTSGHQKLATAFDSVTVARPAWVDTANELDAKADKSYVDQRVPVDSFTGTGSPEGKVAAPVGSIYTDTAATTGAIRWIKTSGTGNTGWRVEYGDTGERVFLDFLSEYTSSTSGRFLSRTNENVRVDVVGRLLDTKGFAEGDVIGTLPAGFRPRRNYYVYCGNIDVVLSVGTNGEVAVFSGSANGYISFTISHSTREPWPATLPGTPA